jgi:Arc/MetJ-type ribon-helix-helix transcriptional regulator
MIAEMTRPHRKKIVNPDPNPYRRKNLTLSPEAQDWLEDVTRAEGHDSQSEVIRGALWLLRMIGEQARRQAVNAARGARPFGSLQDPVQLFCLGSILSAAQDEAERARGGSRTDQKGKGSGKS